MVEHALEVSGPTAWQGGRKWVLAVCPWDASHTNGSAFVVQHASGAISAGCHHDSCRGRDWRALRDSLDPGRREHRQQPSANDKPAASKSPPPPAWQPFPVNALPEPIRSYVVQAAEAIGCDTSYVALPLLAALGSAIGNTRRAKVKSSWREPPAVWTAIIGESGTLKTPAFKAATTTLKRKQAESLAEHAAAMNRYLSDLQTYEADLAAWKTKGRKAGEPPPEKPVEPIAQRYVVGDVTIKALADRLQNAPRGLLVVADELSGWLGGFAQYKPGSHGCPGNGPRGIDPPLHP